MLVIFVLKRCCSVVKYKSASYPGEIFQYLGLGVTVQYVRSSIVSFLTDRNSWLFYLTCFAVGHRLRQGFTWCWCDASLLAGVIEGVTNPSM